MIKRAIHGVILCVFLLSVVFCAGSCGVAETIKGNGGSNMRYRTEEEFLQSIEGRGMGLTPADFDGVDIEGFMDYVEHFEESGGILPVSILLINYKFDLLYPDHELLTKEEFFELLSSADIEDVEDAGLSADVFDTVDFDDFITYTYHIRRCFIDRDDFDPYLVSDELIKYEKWLVLRSGKDYSYLLTGNDAVLKEEDIPGITRIYMDTLLTVDSCGMSVPVRYLLDFEEKTLVVPLDGENYAPRGIYALESTYADRLPDDAIKTIGGFLVARDIATPGKVDFSGSRGFNLFLELKDGRVVRYPCENTPAKIYLFMNDLYGYVLEVEHINSCTGCVLCPDWTLYGTIRSR